MQTKVWEKVSFYQKGHIEPSKIARRRKKDFTVILHSLGGSTKCLLTAWSLEEEKGHAAAAAADVAKIYVNAIALHFCIVKHLA